MHKSNLLIQYLTSYMIKVNNNEKFFICSCFINRSGEWSLIYNAGCLVGIGLLVLGVCMVIIRGISETEKSKSIIVYVLMVVMILVMFFKGKGMYEDYKNGTEEITIQILNVLVDMRLMI